MYYRNKKNPFKKALDQILTVLDKHQDFFLKNPKQLSSIMKMYNDIDYGGRYHPEKHLDAWDNPKYPFEVFEDNDPFYNAVFDAWAYWVRQNEDFFKFGPQKKTELEKKLHKTPEEFLQMKLDPNYRYQKLYANKWEVYNYLFNLFGTGLEWHQGFLVDKEATEEMWADPSELKAEILAELTLSKNKAIVEGKKAYAEVIEKHHSSYKFLLDNLDYQPDPKKIIEELIEISKEQVQTPKEAKELAKFFRSYLKEDKSPGPYSHHPDFTENYSPILTMPENVHPSYIEAALEYCTWITTNKKASAKLKKQATDFIRKHQ